MEFLINSFFSVIPFLIIITILVYIHEYGHYITAIKNGVKVDVFSIGFGPEIYGWTNARGMRWKISAIPLGGYVKLADEDQQFKDKSVSRSHENVQSGSLMTKSVGQKMAISFAGPLANFLYAILVMTLLYSTVGQRIPQDEIIIGHIESGSVGDLSGFKSDDRVLAVNNKIILSAQQLRELIRTNINTGMRFEVKSKLDINSHFIDIKPSDKTASGKLGIEIKANFLSYKHNIIASFYHAVIDTFEMCKDMLTGIFHMLTGKQSTSGLSGPIGIALMTGQIAKQGVIELLFLSSILSINLGLFNLLPIPVLDGGHLIFYAIEGMRGKPLSEKIQENILRVGIILMVLLFLLTFWNDLQGLKFVKMIVSFF